MFSSSDTVFDFETGRWSTFPGGTYNFTLSYTAVKRWYCGVQNIPANNIDSGCVCGASGPVQMLAIYDCFNVCFQLQASVIAGGCYEHGLFSNTCLYVPGCAGAAIQQVLSTCALNVTSCSPFHVADALGDIIITS